MQGVTLLSFLENVGSMPDEVERQYTEWLQCDPILIEAGYLGWVHRKRLYWLASESRALSQHTPLPAEWAWVPPAGQSQPLELRYQGKKPFPPRVIWEQGFTPLFDPSVVKKAGGQGGFHTFTREFFHPSDRVASVSAGAAARFFEDHRRFPPGAYEEHSLLWNRERWRQPSSTERCGVMGLPPACVAHLPQGYSPAQREQTRNSLIGNGFHLPSVMILMCLLPALIEAKITITPPPVAFDALAERLTGTIWEPGRLEAWPGLFGSAEVVERLPPCFPRLQIPKDILDTVAHRLSACRLHRLQEFQAWCQMRGMDTRVLGPTPIFGRDRSIIYAGLSGQRYPSSSSRGLDHLLPPGLGMEQHIQSALELPSPFAARTWPETDVQFVVDYICQWQQCFIARAAEQRRILTSVATAVQPLEMWLDTHRCSSSIQVASGKKPGFCAIMAILLRWPDLVLGEEIIHGFPIVGTLFQSGVFRHVSSAAPPDLDTWLGAAAEEAISKIIHSGAPRFHEEILEVTQEEQSKSFCSPFYTKLELDDRFGAGNWRPMERFMIVQADGKRRVIDNARKSLHNENTEMFETIHTVSVDFVAAVASMLSQSGLASSEEPDWIQLRLGTDDLPDAYRGLPVCDSHLRYSIVAVYVAPLGWRFTILHGLAYGLESAVVSFNRVPQLGIAISRRCAGAIGAAYFDDQLAMEVIPLADISQRGIQKVFTLMGIPPHPEKSFSPAPNRHYLGTSVHVGDFLTAGTIRFQPKAITQSKVLAKLAQVQQDGHLPRDDAGKLRGDLNWLFSMCSGHAGKIAGPLLTAEQQGVCADLSPEDLTTLRLLHAVVEGAEPRDIQVGITPRPPLVIYSDASFEDGVLRLGWVIFGATDPPVGRTCAVPASVLSSWIPRIQQISPGETLCGLLVPTIHPDLLRHRDALWFVDNECAVSALIRASSRQPDIHQIAQFSQAAYHSLQCRVWFEWIDSASNPSDGLSRSGLLDEWSQQQGWTLAEVVFPASLLPENFWQSFTEAVFS